ncbi:hypothetical protein ABIC45_002931 [Mucilaginibacter rubeus]|uniref:hypothetical protein n=1 Tax=Mucilaginibacter rubeus TaxID=2027860 RepID=UPI003398B33F
MLHQISWFTYTVSIISLIILYYLYIGMIFYRREIQSVIYKLSGRQPALKSSGNGDLQIPDYDIMGKAAPESVEFVAEEELSFGPPDEDDELSSDQTLPSEINSRQIGNFSEMVSEVKTLIRVINESSESKENFEMLFRLIVQKYQALCGTPYQQQINDFLMAEGAPEFPFSLNENDLEKYWTEEIKN